MTIAPNGGGCLWKFFFLQNGVVQTMNGIQAGELCTMFYYAFYKSVLFFFESDGFQYCHRGSCSAPEEMSLKGLENLLRASKGRPLLYFSILVI